MRRERARRCAGPAGRATAGILAAALTITACGGNADDDPDRDDARLYTAVLRAVAPGDTSVVPKVIYVELLGDAELTIEDQALVVNAFHSPTTVRFVDERDEAIDDVPQPHVRRDGVLVTLTSATVTDDVATVKATRYVSETDERTVCLDLQERDRTWTVTSTRPC
jgi:hypothetical protein